MMTQQEAEQKAQTIFQQLGGTSRLKAMIGAKDFHYAINNGNLGVNFKYPKSKVHKSNCLNIELKGDLYQITFWTLSKKAENCKQIEVIENVYADQMKSIFEEKTGLYLSL